MTSVIDLTGDDDDFPCTSGNASDSPGDEQHKAQPAVVAGAEAKHRRTRRKKTKTSKPSIPETMSDERKQNGVKRKTGEESQDSSRGQGSLKRPYKPTSVDQRVGEGDDPPQQTRPAPSRTQRPRSPSPMFSVDITRADISDHYAYSDPVTAPNTSKDSASSSQLILTEDLLLPSHVTIFGATSATVEQTLADTEAMLAEGGESDLEYLEYLDDDTKFKRYFEAPEEDTRATRAIICAKCGEEGHILRNCTMLVCDKCGVKNDHTSRNCPIGKQCFTCGMSGHISRDCTNRHTSNHMQSLVCFRCRSTSHITLECPLLWRIYKYVSQETREKTVASRIAAKPLPLGAGGELYIATDEWCYNCGQDGHLGDDCATSRGMCEHPRDPTAFSSTNNRRGLYADVPSGPRTMREPRREAELNTFDFKLTADPGRQGRKNRIANERERERKRQDDLANDWFDDRRTQSHGRSKNNHDRNERDYERGYSRQEPARERRDSGRERDRGSRARDSTKDDSRRLIDRLEGSGSSLGRRPETRSSTFKALRLASNAEQDRRWEPNERHSSAKKANGPRYHGGYRMP